MPVLEHNRTLYLKQMHSSNDQKYHKRNKQTSYNKKHVY